MRRLSARFNQALSGSPRVQRATSHSERGDALGTIDSDDSDDESIEGPLPPPAAVREYVTNVDMREDMKGEIASSLASEEQLIKHNLKAKFSNHVVKTNVSVLPINASDSVRIVKDESLTLIGDQIKQLINDCHREEERIQQDWKTNTAPLLKEIIDNLEVTINNLKKRILSEIDQGSAHVAALEEELDGQLEVQDKTKCSLYFPNSINTLGKSGLYIAFDDLWLENISGNFELEVQPASALENEKSEIVFVLKGHEDSLPNSNGVTAQLHVGFFKLNSDSRAVPAIAFDDLKIEVSVEVRIVLAFNMSTKQWEINSDGFIINMLEFKGPFGLNKGIVSTIIKMAIPILKYQLRKELPPEIGQLMSSLPSPLLVSGTFHIDGELPITSLSIPIFSSKTMCDTIGYSPTQMLNFIGIQKSIDKKPLLLSLMDVIRYKRRYEKLEQWDVLKSLWEQAGLVYCSHISNESAANTKDNAHMNNAENLNQDVNTYLSFERLLCSAEEVLLNPISFRIDLQQLEGRISLKGVVESLNSFVLRQIAQVEGKSGSVSSSSGTKHTATKEEQYFLTKLSNQLEAVTNGFALVLKHLDHVMCDVQVDFHSGSDASLAVILQNIIAQAPIEVYATLPKDTIIGFDFIVPTIMHLKTSSGGVINWKAYQLGCKEMMEKSKFIEYMSSADIDPNDKKIVKSEATDEAISRVFDIVTMEAEHIDDDEIIASHEVELQKCRETMKAKTEAVKHGWMKKKGHIIKNWKKRYFVLEKGRLRYYEHALEVSPFGRVEKGEISLKGSKVYASTTSADGAFFEVCTGGGIVTVIEADNPEAANEWIETIQLHMDYFFVKSTTSGDLIYATPDYQEVQEKVTIDNEAYLDKKNKARRRSSILLGAETPVSHTAIELISVDILRPTISFVAQKPVSFQPGQAMFTFSLDPQQADLTFKTDAASTTTSNVEGCPIVAQTSDHIKLMANVPEVYVHTSLLKLLKFFADHFTDTDELLSLIATFLSTTDRNNNLKYVKFAQLLLNIITKYIMTPNIDFIVNIAIKIIANATDVVIHIDKSTRLTSVTKICMKLIISELMIDGANIKTAFLNCIN